MSSCAPAAWSSSAFQSAAGEPPDRTTRFPVKAKNSGTVASPRIGGWPGSSSVRFASKGPRSWDGYYLSAEPGRKPMAMHGRAGSSVSRHDRRPVERLRPRRGELYGGGTDTSFSSICAIAVQSMHSRGLRSESMPRLQAIRATAWSVTLTGAVEALDGLDVALRRTCGFSARPAAYRAGRSRRLRPELPGSPPQGRETRARDPAQPPLPDRGRFSAVPFRAARRNLGRLRHRPRPRDLRGAEDHLHDPGTPLRYLGREPRRQSRRRDAGLDPDRREIARRSSISPCPIC